MGQVKLRADASYGYIDTSNSLLRLDETNKILHVWTGSSWTELLTEEAYSASIYNKTAAFFSVAVPAYGTALAFDSSGNLYWAVTPYYDGTTYSLTSYVYKITPNGMITTFASQATTGAVHTALQFDSSGNLYWSVILHDVDVTSYVYKITSGGTKTTFASQVISGAAPVATDLIFDSSGNLYWVITVSNNNTDWSTRTSYLYKITSGGTKTEFATHSGNGVRGTSLAFDTSGNLYWAVTNYYNGTTFNHTSYVYKITSGGTKTTFASEATSGSMGTALTFDSSGNLYWAITNRYNGTTYNLTSYVYKITPGGTKTSFASQATNGAHKTDLIFDSSGNLFWAMNNQYNGTTYNLTSYVYKITPGGTKTTFAYTPTSNSPTGKLLIDSNDNLYWAVSNAFNNVTSNLVSFLYKITPAGKMLPIESVLNSTYCDIQFDSIGNLYWAIDEYYSTFYASYKVNSYVYVLYKSYFE